MKNIWENSTPKRGPLKPSEITKLGGARSDASGTNAGVNPAQKDKSVVKESLTPSFDDFSRYFEENFEKNFENNGIYCEDLRLDISEKIKQSGDWYERAKRIYDGIILKKGLKLDDEITKIKNSDVTSEKKNKQVHDLYFQEIFQPIFDELIKDIPKEERMSQDELREDLNRLKDEINNFTGNSHDEYEKMWEIYKKLEKYKKRYPLFRENLNEIVKKIDERSGDYIKGIKVVDGINNPKLLEQKLKGEIEKYCNEIVNVTDNNVSVKDERNEIKQKLAIINDHKKRLNKLNSKYDPDLARLIEEASDIAEAVG